MCRSFSSEVEKFNQGNCLSCFTILIFYRTRSSEVTLGRPDTLSVRESISTATVWIKRSPSFPLKDTTESNTVWNLSLHKLNHDSVEMFLLSMGWPWVSHSVKAKSLKKMVGHCLEGCINLCTSARVRMVLVTVIPRSLHWSEYWERLSQGVKVRLLP